MTSLELLIGAVGCLSALALLAWGATALYLCTRRVPKPPRKLSDSLVDVIACDFTGDDGQRVTITVVPSNADVAHVLMRSSGRRLGAEFKLVAVDGDQSVIEFEFLQIRKGVNQR